jgi:hypothetical protein
LTLIHEFADCSMAPGLLLALCAAAWGSSQASTVEGIHVAGFSTSDEGSMTHMIDYTRGRLRFESGIAKGEFYAREWVAGEAVGMVKQTKQAKLIFLLVTHRPRVCH